MIKRIKETVKLKKIPLQPPALIPPMPTMIKKIKTAPTVAILARLSVTIVTK